MKEAKGKEEIEKDVEEEEEFMDQFGNIKEDKIDDSDDEKEKTIGNSEQNSPSAGGRGRGKGGERGKGRGNGENERGRGEPGRGRGERGGNRGRGERGSPVKQTCKERKKDRMKPGGNPGWRDLDSEIAREVEEQIERERSGGGNAEVFQKLLAPAYPEFSNLSWLEQDKFLMNLAASQEGRLGPNREVDWQYFQNFQQIVHEERQEFVQFVTEALKTFPTPTILSPEHRRYASEHREARLGRALQLPRHWEKVRDIRLAPAHPEAAAEMRLQRNLAELGRIPKAVIPTILNYGTISEQAYMKGKPRWLNQRKTLPGRYPRIANSVPVDPSLAPGGSGQSRGEARMARHGGRMEQEEKVGKESKVDTDVYLHKVPTPSDPNAEKLARLMAPQVFISASALCCLMDNHGHLNYARAWIIPITIRTYNCQGSSLQKKVIFLGKPLPQRTVTNEDLAKIASKAALSTMLFTPEWHQQSREKVEKASVFAPEEEEDIFGGSNIALDQLEVFGVDSKPTIKEVFQARDENKTKSSGDTNNSQAGSEESGERIAVKDGQEEKLGQLDGALSEQSSSDSEADNLVIATDEPEASQEDAPRRSSRQRKPTMRAENIAALSLGRRGRKNSSRSNTDQEHEDEKEKKKSLLKEKEEGILEQESTKESDETVKSRSQTEKMPGQVVKAEDIPQTSNAGSDVEDESSSDSGDDDEAMRKLYLQKLQQAQTLKESSMEISIDDQNPTSQDMDPEDLEETKESEERGEDLTAKSSVGASKKPTSGDLFGSESGSDDDNGQGISPAKKIRPIESSSDEELRKKLAGMGKEAADVKEVKRKVAMNKKLKEMEKRREGRAALEEKERKARLGGRRNNKMKSEVERESSGEDRSQRREMESSDEDEEESDSKGRKGRRFNKFAATEVENNKSSGNVGGGIGLLDNLLDNQQSMLKKEERFVEGKKSMSMIDKDTKSNKVEYRGELLHNVGEGLGESIEYQPPAPHTNLSYRLWNLGWKNSNVPPMQVLLNISCV